MSTGVDIYRYQTVTDWRALAGAVKFAWVKLTDGGGPAVVRGDKQVNGCKNAGILVGGYHYAQPSPAPEVQARVFNGELERLRADDIVPALDLEAPFTPNDTARQFAIRFLHEMVKYGHRPAVYMSASWAATLRPDRWDIPGLVIWIAAYGRNDGRRYPEAVTRFYPGRCDVHQYTSTGRVAGISGNVDVNEALTDIRNNLEEDDVSADEVFNRKIERQGSALKGETTLKALIANYDAGLEIARAQVAALSGKVDALLKVVSQLAGDEELDLEAVRAAAEAGTRKALEEGTVNVDIDVTGPRDETDV